MARSLAWSWPGGAVALVLAASAMNGGLPRTPLIMAAEALEGPVSAVVERVIDGDTLEVRAAIWLGQTLVVRVRIEGVDAPELRSPCAEERKLALAARDFLARRLEGASVKLARVSYDKYGGRVRAIVSDAQGDLARDLIARGLARPYRGEQRSPWCAPA